MADKLNGEAQVIQFKGFLFAFKGADTSDNKIIAYGWCNYLPGKKPNLKKFKVTYQYNRNGCYFLHEKIGRKYYEAGHFESLIIALTHAKTKWVENWGTKP